MTENEGQTMTDNDWVIADLCTSLGICALIIGYAIFAIARVSVKKRKKKDK